MTYSLKQVKKIVKKHKLSAKEVWKDDKKRYKKEKKFYKKNGFYAFDSWEFCSQACCWMLPRLVCFRDNHCGTPAIYLHGEMNPSDEITAQADKEWTEDINKIINAMVAYLEDDFTVENYEKHVEMMDKGFEILGKSFRNLWD